MKYFYFLFFILSWSKKQNIYGICFQSALVSFLSNGINDRVI